MPISSIDKEFKNLDTVRLSDEGDSVLIIDQTLLPNEVKILSLTEEKEMYDAIYLLQVRGAPAIGVFAALSMYVLSLNNREEDRDSFIIEFKRQKDYLDSARPTAVNLSWALKRMESVLLKEAQVKEKNFRERFLSVLKKEAISIYEEDIETCKKIGENGVTLIKDGDGIITHCNAGRLATVRYGTATAPMYLAKEKGLNIKVFCDETRPLLQGARLTAFELSKSGIDTTLICDNMSASVMKKGWVNAVFVGADRIAANGDAANKIGTSLLATAAKRYNIPFYVCAPRSTIDPATRNGNEIHIEERNPKEVTELWYEKRMAPKDIKVYNPAFDVTDADLISGIVTEYGVLKPPFTEAIKGIF
ncbi:MAG: S-methyl-5-thioribose-1-phosphate isomerase [Lachnospiraceae bacterium]|nr:S-methyl-5-thioribose-1-phosphate isomerase [Lachnospiraceae bacterium]